MDKPALLAALLQELQRELDVLTQAAHLARDEAISEESRAESKWDTRGQEAAYLAEGQARIAADLQESISLWQSIPLESHAPPHAIGIGTVFVVKQPHGTLRGIIGPRSGGTEFEFEGQIFTAVTPISPLGRNVVGRRAGDFISLPGKGKPRPQLIAETY